MEEKKEFLFNTACDQLRSRIIHDINESKLPVGAVYYIYQVIGNEISSQYSQALVEEASKMETPYSLDQEEEELAQQLQE